MVQTIHTRKRRMFQWQHIRGQLKQVFMKVKFDESTFQNTKEKARMTQVATYLKEIN